MSGETTRVDLFVRSLSPRGARGRPSAVVDRLEELLAAGHIDEYSVYVWGAEVGLSTPAAGAGEGRAILDRVAAFRSWADRRGVALEGFDRRETTAMTGETRTVLVLPVLALAEYADGELVGVAPRSGDGAVTVEDRLAALSRRAEGRDPEAGIEA